MADNMRQRSVKEELKSEAKARRAQSVLIYGEQRASRVDPLDVITALPPARDVGRFNY